MQNLARNDTVVWYCLYTGQTEIIDSYGNKTGTFTKTYGPLQSAMLMVAPNKGDAYEAIFGTLKDYDRAMTTADTSCPIDEETILWLDNAPTSGPYTHYVKKRAPWKNSIAFAAKQVEKTNG